MAWWSKALQLGGAIGGAVAAPFTGGTSLLASHALLAGLGGAAAIGGALENRQGARTSTTSTTENPTYAGLGDLLRQRITDRLNSTYDMGGYAANGIQGINDAFGGAQTGLDASLTSRGLGTSPVAGAGEATLQAARGSNIAQFLNSLPQLRRDMQAQDLGLASNFYAQRPQTTTTVAPGSVAGGAFGSAAEMIAYMSGKGLLGGGGGTKVKNLPGSIGTIG